jgi:hypothetical protein
MMLQRFAAPRHDWNGSIWGRGLSILAAGAVVGLLSASADAAVYTVSGCRTGWTPEWRMTAGSFASATYDLCDTPTYRSLSAGLAGGGARANPGDYAGWRFDAPADTAIVGISLMWTGHGDYATADGGPAPVRLDASNTAELRNRFDVFATTDSVAVADADWVRAVVLCDALPGSTCRTSFAPPDPPDALRVAIVSSRVSLIDRLTPTIAQVAGAAATGTTWAGPQPLSFTASDKGSGVFRVDVEVDGSVVQTIPASSDGRCVDGTGTRDFAFPVPCPLQVSGNVEIDTAGLPAGQHTVTVYVEDAAGNRAVVLPPSSRLIVNDHRAVGYYANGMFFNPRFATPRTANGDGAVSGANLSAAFVRQVGKGRSRHSVRRAMREVRFSQSPTVRGTLSAPSGEPIANATVFIGQQPEGQQWRLDGAVRTDSAGDFVYRPAARHPNRQLRAVYFPFSDSHENASSDPLELRVRAGMTLHVSRRSLRNGQRLVFTGRVLGALPAAGIAVTLQAKVGRHYRSFRQLRASSGTGGRIRTAYRFERTTGPVRYRFRLKVVRQAGLPFQSGASPVVAVSVRR